MEQHELPGFLEAAAELRLKGLSEAEAERVSLVQLAHNHPSLDMSVVGGVAPEHSKMKGRGKRSKNIRNLKKELEEEEEVDFNTRESGHHTTKTALHSGVLGPKKVNVDPKLSIVRRMSMTNKLHSICCS